MIVRRLAAGVALVLATAGPLQGQNVTWKSLVTLYGDNTEFFTPYRIGETILGGQFTTALVIKPAEKFGVELGVFGDVRWGSDRFLDTVRPVISFRYRTPTSLGVVGTLETVRRHGLLEPLEVTTLELNRPIEYGLQWIERRRWWDAEAFINWQAVNKPNQQEAFDYGWVVRLRPIRQITLEHQLHGVHHGGQLFATDLPAISNTALAIGVTLADTIPKIGFGSLAVFRLGSSGRINPEAPEGQPSSGHGTYVRAGLAPVKGVEVFSILWRGRDFLSQEGDNNYNSAGANPSFYRSRRKYLEVGVARRGQLDGGVQLDAELRFHRIDDESSIAIGHSRWEYSYRLVVRTPFKFELR